MDNALPYLPDIFFWNLRDTFQPAPLSKTSMKGHRRWGAAKKRSERIPKSRSHILLHIPPNSIWKFLIQKNIRKSNPKATRDYQYR
jgi:hypothetical protein